MYHMISMEQCVNILLDTVRKAEM